MGKWLLTLAICIPMTAHADPKADRPRSDRSYAVTPPASRGYIPDGWAVRATLQGRSMDLGSRDWAEDPHVQAHDVEAGYGWRDGRASAMIGYESHDYGPRLQRAANAVERDPNQPPPVTSPGVLGFSFVLHGR
jgi:hypothetical protein